MTANALFEQLGNHRIGGLVQERRQGIRVGAQDCAFGGVLPLRLEHLPVVPGQQAGVSSCGDRRVGLSERSQSQEGQERQKDKNSINGVSIDRNFHTRL